MKRIIEYDQFLRLTAKNLIADTG